jgi:hypothetical protein
MGVCIIELWSNECTKIWEINQKEWGTANEPINKEIEKWSGAQPYWGTTSSNIVKHLSIFSHKTKWIWPYPHLKKIYLYLTKYSLFLLLSAYHTGKRAPDVIERFGRFSCHLLRKVWILCMISLFQTKVFPESKTPAKVINIWLYKTEGWLTCTMQKLLKVSFSFGRIFPPSHP